MSDETMTLPTEDVRQLFDLVVHSMDFGSGFLDSDDVTLLRRVAEHIGVDPMVATPSEFKRDYPHPFKRHKMWNGVFSDACDACGQREEHPTHAEAVDA